MDLQDRSLAASGCCWKFMKLGSVGNGGVVKSRYLTCLSRTFDRQTGFFGSVLQEGDLFQQLLPEEGVGRVRTHSHYIIHTLFRKGTRVVQPQLCRLQAEVWTLTLHTLLHLLTSI